MANVSEFLQQLLNARYGKDVRQSIHDSIRAINKQLEESDASALASAQVAKTAATEAKNAVDNIGTTVDNYIKNQSNVVTDDNFGEKANAYLGEKLYPILENEIGVVNTQYEYGDVRRYGAIGDGVTDDSDAIVNAFKAQRAYPNIIIKLEKRKTYICRKSPNIGTCSFLEGNEATLVIDTIQNYGDTQIQFFWDNGYEGNIKLINWENLNIDFSPELITRTNGDVALLWLFKIHDCEEFRMKNVNIISDGDERNHTNIFTFDGHGKIFLDNCYFKNTMRGKEDGSILWIQSKLADGYYARINNCHFYSNTWDEAISCFCTGTHDVVINGCTIEKYWRDSYYNRQQELINFCGFFVTNNYLTPKTFTDDEISSIYHNVVYKNCKMTCKPLNPETSIGIKGMSVHGNYYATPSMLKFENCDIELQNLEMLILGDANDTYSNNVDWLENTNTIFDNCKIKLSNFIGNRGVLRSKSTNLTIQNSKMTLDKYIYNQVWVESNVCTCFNFNLLNNQILVRNSTSVLFKTNPLGKESYRIIGNDFITLDNDGNFVEAELLVESTSSDGYTSEKTVFTHATNATYNFIASNNRINGKMISSNEGFNDVISAYITENNIGNTTKVINVMDNNIAKCKIDGVTDDYQALSAIMTYVNNTTEPITVVFPYTGKAMNISDTIYVRRSNVTLEIYCDVQFTKSLFTEGQDMNVFVFNYSYVSRTPISNVNLIGHNITINANGASLGIKQASHTQVAKGNGVRFERILGGAIKGVHVTNALCDGILVYVSKNVVVEDCEISETIMDNGLTIMGLPLFESDWVFDKYADRCWNNVIVRNCTAHNNEDLGFSASCCHGVTFENCLSYANGNVDGFNAGGGYSAEILHANTKMFFEVPIDFDMDIIFRNCKALNNNNYAFYTDVDGVTIDNCNIDKTVANDTTTSNGRNIRGGNGIFANCIGRLDVLNTYISNTAMYAICANPNSNVSLRLEKLNVTDCAKGVYVPCVAFLYVKDFVCKNTTTPIYLNDGTKKKYVELKNISLYDCTGAYIGGTEYLDADNIYLRTASGVTVAATLGNVDTGILQNVKVYKGDNTSWLTGVYILDTTGTAFSVSTSMLTDANTTITDKRVATT